MNDDQEPQRISDKEISLNITGHLLPAFHNDQPVLIAVKGTSDLFVPVFSTIEKLHAFMDETVIKIPYDKVKKVLDGREFIESVIPHARIAVDLHTLPNGRLRWTEVISTGGKA